MRYPGLIPGKQKNVGEQEYGWCYGRMTLDGKKYIDPMLNFGCYTLGYGRMQIMNYVRDNMCIKPEIGENFFDNQPLKLNNCAWKLAKILKGITGYRSIFALSGSDAVEGAVKLASAYQSLTNKRKKIVTFENSCLLYTSPSPRDRG